MPAPFLNLTTGDVFWPEEGEDVNRHWEDENLLAIEADLPSDRDYENMEEFVHTLDDGDLKEQLARAISGKGAFRRFRGIINHGAYVAEKHAWFWFERRKMREAILAWLEENEIAPLWVGDDDILQASPLPDKRVPLLEATLAFVEKVKKLPGVRRIALQGSLCTDKAIPEGVDLLVEVDDQADLTALAKSGRQLTGKTMATGDNCGADIFICNQAGDYLGRTCHWKTCEPGIRHSCHAQHCGRRQFLHDDLQNIKLDPEAIQSPPLELWPKVIARVDLPDDVTKILVSQIVPS